MASKKKSSKKKETRMKKKIVEVSQETSNRKKRTGNWKVGMRKFLASTLSLLARITLTLISSSACVGCFQKDSFQEFNLAIWNFEFPSAFLYASCQLFENLSVLCSKKLSVLVKIRNNSFYVTNVCLKVTSKLILPSVSRFKFWSQVRQEGVSGGGNGHTFYGEGFFSKKDRISLFISNQRRNNWKN